MKYLFFLLVTVISISCHQGTEDKALIESTKIEAAKDNACIKCTEKVQAELVACLAKAKTPAEKSACNKKASDDWVSQCRAICTPGIQSESMQTNGSGACTKCTCPSFREDATDGKCLNIQPPHPNKLCQHMAKDHK